ncbi:MAG: leucyl aminopeptidase [Actinobacteria bacterium]|nr:leucyl aminopeptidase [Actinomycetota bacterium]
MTMMPNFSLAASTRDADVVAIPVAKGPLVLGDGDGSGIDAAFLEASGFEGKSGEVLVVPGPTRTTVMVGVGPVAKVDAHVLRRASAAVVRASWKRTSVALCLLEAVPEGMDRAEAVKALVEGAGLAAYRYTVHKSEPKPCRVAEVTVIAEVTEHPGLQRVIEHAGAVVEAVCLARDLVNEPPGSMTPVRLADVAVEVGERAGLSVEVIDEEGAVDLGLGGLLGVAQGSDHPPRLVKMIWNPAGTATASVALVGKGITFDSGGLSLKTGEGMMTMKSDMAGAAAVLATMSVLPVLKPGVSVVGYLAVAENMPSGKAIRPGDVLRTRAGKTVEVLNTDAEGRLVLADALALAVEDGADAIVDLATLTGACVVALGSRIAGMMGTSDGLRDQLQAAAHSADERLWPLPLPGEYRKHIDSDVADLKNIGNGRYAGALTAGLFLKEFTGKVPWAHLDIAGPAFVDADDAWVAKGATGFGIRTLLAFLDAYVPVGADADADGADEEV